MFKKSKNNRIKTLIKGAILFYVCVLLVVSCKKNEGKSDPGNSGPAQVTVKAGSVIFEDIVPIGDRAHNVNVENFGTNNVQMTSMKWNDDFMLIAEVRRISQQSPGEENRSKTAAESNDLKAMTRYNVAIFDESGNFIEEKSYVHTQEGSTMPIKLDGGKQHTFIAFSINSTTEIPSLTWTDPNNKILANAKLVVDGKADLLYHRKDMVVNGSEDNVLIITFKHLFSQYEVSIDASVTGYNITSITAGYSGHFPNAEVKMENGKINRIGSVATSMATFSSLNAPAVTSDPTIVNALENKGEFRISSITVGPLTRTDLVPFPDLEILPGYRYEANIKLVTNDGYLDWGGFPAVRIGGDIWMRHNLGANTTVNPDITPITSDLHGNYYQPGRITSVGNGTSFNVTGASLNNRPSIDALNLGSEDAPVKNIANDPCPLNYRIPSRIETQRLISNTTGSSIGDRTDDSTNYTGATVLTSKRKRDIKMVIPAQGFYNVVVSLPPIPPFTISPIAERGLLAIFWNNYIDSSFAISYFRQRGNEEAIAVPKNGDGPNWTTLSYPVRCIAVQ